MGKRVLLLTGSFGNGGAEKRNVDIANFLYRKKRNFTLAVLNDSGAFRQQLDAGIEVHVLTHNGHTFFGILPLVRLLWLVRRKKIDLIYSNLYRVNIYALIVALVKNVYVYIGIYTNPLRHRSMISRMLYGRTDLVITNSERSSEAVQSIFEKRNVKTRTIYNGVDLDRANSFLARSHDLSHLPRRERRLVAVSIGSLRKVKGIDVVLESISLIREAEDILYVVVGEGPEINNLKALVNERGLEENVLFTGFEPNPYKYLGIADVFILASWYEGMPNVLLEAMAAGTPVVSTRAQFGPDEMILNGKSGILVDPGDYVALASAVLRIYRDTEFANSLVDEATSTLKTRFDSRKMLLEYEKTLYDMDYS